VSVLISIVEEERKLKCEEVALLGFSDLEKASPSQGNKIDARDMK